MHAFYTIPIDPAHPATLQRPTIKKAIAILLRRAPLGAARTRRHCEYRGGVVRRRRWLSGRWVPYGPRRSPGFPSSKGWKFLRCCKNIHGHPWTMRSPHFWDELSKIFPGSAFISFYFIHVLQQKSWGLLGIVNIDEYCIFELWTFWLAMWLCVLAFLTSISWNLSFAWP